MCQKPQRLAMSEMRSCPSRHFGSVEANLHTEPDVDRKLVVVSDLGVDNYIFSGVPVGKDTSELELLVKDNAREGHRNVPLDLFLAYIDVGAPEHFLVDAQKRLLVPTQAAAGRESQSRT